MEIVKFNFNNVAEIRVIEIDNEPWFVAKDVADVLEYTDTATMTRRLDDDEKGVQNLQTLGGNQNFTIINESGLYNAILGSNKPEAKAFKKWITGEVLPSVRKHGMYASQQKLEEFLADPNTMIKTLQALQEERTKRIEAERTKAHINDTRTATIMGKLSGAIRTNEILNKKNARLEEELAVTKGECNYSAIAEVKWLKDYVTVTKAKNAIGHLITKISNSNGLEVKYRKIVVRGGADYEQKVYHNDAWQTLRLMLDNDHLTLKMYRKKQQETFF